MERLNSAFSNKEVTHDAASKNLDHGRPTLWLWQRCSSLEIWWLLLTPYESGYAVNNMLQSEDSDR